MDPKLTKDQERELGTQLGNVSLKLLYKASVHGFTAAAFHQRCDAQGPTVSVGYNSTGFVFGGYTSKAFDQTDQKVQDDKAFLFTFSGRNLVKYHCINPAHAMRMNPNNGPYFGEEFVLLHGNKPVVYSVTGAHFNSNAAEMHGNNLQLTECEVYQVGESMGTPWRTILWEPETKKELMKSIELYKSAIASVSQVRVLLIGPVGVGKSSFFNSIKSIFSGHVTSQAIAGSSGTSLTTMFRTYSVKAGRDGKALPIVLCDTMGLEEATGAGLDVTDVSSILKGHIPNRYQFNPSAPMQADAMGYCKTVSLKDRIHCVAYVIDASKVSIMSAKLEEKLSAIRKQANLSGVPQLVLMTKVDEACPYVAKDLKDIYLSPYIKEKAKEVSCRLGVPLSCVVPVKNYSEELELDLCCDILLLSAVRQMLRYADDYFDDISDQFSDIKTHD